MVSGGEVSFLKSIANVAFLSDLWGRYNGSLPTTPRGKATTMQIKSNTSDIVVSFRDIDDNMIEGRIYAEAGEFYWSIEAVMGPFNSEQEAFVDMLAYFRG